jgi:hypothetical protein
MTPARGSRSEHALKVSRAEQGLEVPGVDDAVTLLG